MTAEDRISAALKINRSTVDLARYVCVASRIQPALIRQARIRYVPHADVGTEADVQDLPRSGEHPQL